MPRRCLVIAAIGALALRAPCAIAQSYPPPPPEVPAPGMPAPAAVSTLTHPYLASLPGSVRVLFVSEGEPVAISALAGTASVTYANPWMANNAYSTRRSIQPLYDYLCTTPCTLSLPPGGTTLHLGTAMEWPRDITVVTTPGVPRRVVLRHASAARPIGGIFMMLGGMFGTLGGALVMAFAPLMGSGGSPSEGDFLLGGGIALGVGAGLLTTGIWLLATPNGGVVRDEPMTPPTARIGPRWIGASVLSGRDGSGALVTSAWAF